MEVLEKIILSAKNKKEKQRVQFGWEKSKLLQKSVKQLRIR